MKKKTALVFSAMAGIILATMLVFQLNFRRVYELILEKDMEQVEDTSNFVTELLYTKIQNLFSVLSSNQKIFWEHEDGNLESVVQRLKKIKEEERFDTIGVMDLQGKSMDDSGEGKVITDTQWLDSIRKNQRYISNIEEVSDRILLAVPIVKNGEVRGAIWGYYSVALIADEIELSKDSHRYFQIVDDSGKYISDSNNVNSSAENMSVWEELQRYELSDGVTVEEIYENIEQGKTGYFHFTFEGQGRYVTYEPLGIKNWYVFSVLTEKYLGSYVTEIEKIFSRILMGTLGIILLSIGILGFFVYKTMRLTKEQNESLFSKNKLLFMALKYTKDIPFEVDIAKKRVSIYSNEDSGKMLERDLEEFTPEYMLKKDLIEKKQYREYKEFCENILSGKPVKPVIIKMKMGGKWNYNRISMEILNQNHIIGFLEDYNELVLQNRQIQEISEKAQRDALTGLYCRGYFVQEVEKILTTVSCSHNGTCSALFLLDLDCFKQANDTLGHMLGDRILKDTGRILHSVVRGSDLVGRLGGDEFVVFIREARDIAALRKCAEKINAALKRTYGEEKTVTVSASIGIAVWTGERSFAELYKMADTALYKVKESGKDGYNLLSGSHVEESEK